MRSIKTVALVAATLLLVPQLAAAADLDTEVQEMKNRLEQMETQLKAQDKELAAAQEDRSATSALSSFLESTDISGFVAGGWNWTKESDGGPEDNTFAVQQYWIEMNKALQMLAKVWPRLARTWLRLAKVCGYHREPLQNLFANLPYSLLFFRVRSSVRHFLSFKRSRCL